MNPRLRTRLFVLVTLIGVFLWQRSRRMDALHAERMAKEPTLVFAASKPAELALATPQQTLATQLGLLKGNDYDRFKQTFLVAVSQEQFDACKARMEGVPLKPDWEMAKETTQAGNRVVRVSLFGKSYTDFHFIDGKVLTAQLWCLPPG